jgi:hypothetical protein
MLLALLAAASMWFFVDTILFQYQVARATALDMPRGNLSDLYPRWLGARELLLHRRNPYGREITLEIQKGYYGRSLNPSLPNDPKDQQAFAYPVYVVFLLAPAVMLPFWFVQSCFFWGLAGLSVASLWCWLKVLRWRISLPAKFVCLMLLLGSFPAVQALKLQQLSLLVAGLLAVGIACVVSGYSFLGGAILALATIKPQLALPMVAALLLWVGCQWKTRWRLAAGFSATMAVLLAASQWVLPGWWKMFWQATREYHQYTGNQSVLDQLVNWGLGPWGGSAVAAIAVLACVALLWRLRHEPADSENFGSAVALVMAVTVLIVPMYAPYNQVLLVPSILLLAKERRKLISESRVVRIVYYLALFAFAWAWLASMGLTLVWFFSPAAAMDARELPLFATFSLPVLVFMLTLISLRRHGVLRVRDATG